MAWSKTKNMYSRDIADALADQNLLDTNMIGTIWGSGVPASSKEDGAFQRIAMDVLRRAIRRNGASGFLTKPTYVFSAGFPANTFNMPKSEVYLDGLASTIAGTNLNSDTDNRIQLTAPPVSGTRLDLVFLECWITEIIGSTASVPVATKKPDATHVYKWGNVSYGGTNPLDDINEVNFEIRRRVQIQYRIKTYPGANFGLYPNGVNDPANGAQGPNAVATALPFVQSSSDAGLYVAGDGSVAHQTILGTLDGFVYAIPLAQVLRTTGVTIVSVTDVTDLRTLWGGSSGTLAVLAGDNLFTGRQQFAKGVDLSPSGTTITLGSDGNMFTVNGNGPWTGISTLKAGVEIDLLFPNPVNLIHNDTTFILPYRKIYRTVANEIITVKSIGTGWIVKSRSGPSEPVGTSLMHNGLTAPDGYVLEYLQALSATQFEGLLTEYLASGFVSATAGVPGAPIWSTFTANAATNEITVSNHGKVVGDVVFFNNVGGALPGNLVAFTKYYVEAVTGVNTFRVSAARGGSAVDISTAGSGTLNAYQSFYAGDMNGRVAIASDALGGSDAGRVTDSQGSILGAGLGEDRHVQTLAELAAHTHTENGSVGTPGYAGAASGGSFGGRNTGSAGTSAPMNVMQPYQTKIAIVRV